MTNQFKFPINRLVSLCSALPLLLPGHVLAQTAPLPARFTAWGSYSKVLVPRAAKAIRLGAEKVNVAGWALTDVEMAKAINTCAGTL